MLFLTTRREQKPPERWTGSIGRTAAIGLRKRTYRRRGFAAAYARIEMTIHGSIYIRVYYTHI